MQQQFQGQGQQQQDPQAQQAMPYQQTQQTQPTQQFQQTQQTQLTQQFQSGLQSQQAGQEQVVAVRKNGDGDIVELKLSSGNVVDYMTAQQMVKNNLIANLNVFRGRDGDEHLRSNADGDPTNNLDNLPTF